MVNKKYFYLFFSIFSYCVALLMYVLAPVLILNESNIELSELNIFCCIFTMLSCFFLTHRFQGKKGIKFIYIILFFMTYIALVFGNNNLFDFIVKKLFQYYEYNNLTESYQYEKLWNIWAKENGGETLEMYLKREGVDAPDFIDNPDFWDKASKNFAETASGEVDALIGPYVRDNSIWNTIEKPILNNNKDVTSINIINPLE